RQVLAPVVPKRAHVPSIGELEQDLSVSALHDARCLHLILRIRIGAAILAELQARDFAADQREHLGPDMVGGAAFIRCELASHDPVDDDHVPFRPARAAPRCLAQGSRVQTSISLVAEMRAQHALFVSIRACQDPSELFDVRSLDSVYEGAFIEHGPFLMRCLRGARSLARMYGRSFAQLERRAEARAGACLARVRSCSSLTERVISSPCP